MNGWDMLAFVVVVVGCLWLRKGWSGLSGGTQDQADPYRGMPSELRRAELAYAEATFRSARHRLIARVDRAYRVGDEIVLMELKTRRRPAANVSDVIELSVQRVALAHETGERVCVWAWVVMQSPATQERIAVRVRLLDEEQVVALKARYDALERLPMRELAFARHRSMCERCGHRSVCEEATELEPARRSSARSGARSPKPSLHRHPARAIGLDVDEQRTKP